MRVRPTFVHRQPSGWNSRTFPGAHGRPPSRSTIAALATAWTALLLVPTVYVAVNGDDLYTSALAPVVFLNATEAALAVLAGYMFRRRGTKHQATMATVFGVLTMGIASTIQVVSYSSYAGDPPWAAALVLNVVVNAPLVVLAVALGVGLAAWKDWRESRPAKRP